MAINDTALLEIIGTCGGQQHIQTLHFRYDDALSSEQGLIDEWQAGCRTAYRGCFKSDDEPVQLLRARQVCGSLPLRAPVEEVEVAGSRAGTWSLTGDRAPTWLAVLTNHRTAFAGPSRRGRSFMGGMWEALIIGNELGSTVIQAVYEAYWAAVMSVFGPAGSSTYTFVIHSHKLASVPGTQCIDSSTIVTSNQVVMQLASMKSRKPGHGN